VTLRPIIAVHAELTVNDIEAEVLAHLCSYDLAEYFAEKCSPRLSPDFLQKTMSSLRSKAEMIVEARDAAMKDFLGRNL
jgi:hypothetical protein